MFATSFSSLEIAGATIHYLHVDRTLVGVTAQWLSDRSVTFRIHHYEDHVGFHILGTDIETCYVDELNAKFNNCDEDGEPPYDGEEIPDESCDEPHECREVYIPDNVLAELEFMHGGGSDYPSVMTPMGFVCHYNLTQQDWLLPYLCRYGTFYAEVMELRELSLSALSKKAENFAHWECHYSEEDFH